MDGKQAIGLALILLGVLILVSAILGRTGSTLTALIFGKSALAPAPARTETPTVTPGGGAGKGDSQ